jgi:phosphohistidine phosphatase
VEALATEVAGRGVKPVAIRHSGKLRARQTGEAFLRVCNPMAEFSAVRGLQPEDPPEWIVDMIAGEHRDLMLVGHMPHLPRLLTLLVTRQRSPILEFPLHGLVALEYGDEGWNECWRVRT